MTLKKKKCDSWQVGRLAAVNSSFLVLDNNGQRVKILYSNSQKHYFKDTYIGDLLCISPINHSSDNLSDYSCVSDTTTEILSNLENPLSSNFLRNDLCKFSNLFQGVSGHLKIQPLTLVITGFVANLTRQSDLSTSLVLPEVNPLTAKMEVIDCLRNSFWAALRPNCVSYFASMISGFKDLFQKEMEFPIYLDLKSYKLGFHWCDIYVDSEHNCHIQKINSVPCE